MRATGRAGWALVSYFKAPGKRYSDEIVFVRLDGSRTVERLARAHSKTSGCYRCEVHPVASPDGQRVLFASNWASDCTDCGEADEIQAYVIERVSAQRSTTNLPSSSSPAARTR